jgi:Family of unknown function (DUF5808)
MIRRIRRLVKIAAFAVFVAAISQEMSKPEGERTWRGKVGVVPYDFNPPTWDRLLAAYWNPEDERLFTDRVFGVGWAINFYRVRELMLGGYQQLMGVKLPASQRWQQRTARAKQAKPEKAAADS